MITCPELLVTATVKATSTCFSTAVVFSISNFILPNLGLFMYITEKKKKIKIKIIISKLPERNQMKYGMYLSLLYLSVFVWLREDVTCPFCCLNNDFAW